MCGQRAVPECNGQNLAQLNVKQNHENMLNQVSNLVNLKNDKKQTPRKTSPTKPGNLACIQSDASCTNLSMKSSQKGILGITGIVPNTHATSAGNSSCKTPEEPAQSKISPELTEDLEIKCIPKTVSVSKDKVPNQHEESSIGSCATDASLRPDRPPLTPNLANTSPTLKRIVRSDGFYLEASVEGVKMTFTIDTGATKTVISEKIYNSIPQSKRPKLTKTAGLTEASGQPLLQLGTALFSVVLDGVQFSTDIIVANIEDDGLFGHDLLSEGDAHILYDERALVFLGVQIPCIQVDSTPKIRRITAADRFVIPGHSEKIIDVFVNRLQGDDQQKSSVLLEPSLEFQDRYGLFMASSLSDLNSNVTHKVRLLNPNKFDISINQDATLGTAEEVSEISMIHNGKESPEESTSGNALPHRASSNQKIGTRRVQVGEIPEHLLDLHESACKGRTDEEKDVIARTLIKFQDTFSKNEFDLGLTSLTEHTIDVGGHPPIKQAPRRVPVAFASEEENVIKQLEEQGVIRKSTSPWASPICLVRKRSGKIRPCVDYRRLNEITVKDAFPLPRISDCLDAVAGAKFLSTFDMTSGFHQIKIRESDIPKTAFCTKYGLFEYLTMPMGMTNSPAVFQRLMELALRGLQWHICLIYLDDVLVFGSDFEQHMDRVHEVLSRITEAGLKLKPEKCQLLQTSVSFLGHTISAEGVLPNPDNLAKIKQWPIPTNTTQVRQILGLGSYYRRFIQGYSDLVRPLTLLTHKDTPFVWSEECQQTFEILKERLMGSEIMAYPKDEGLYILDTDASDTQISGVLSQIQDEKERVISYGSRSLNKAERNYCITDKELLAIRHFVEYYRQYLLGRKFLVRSDHNSLTFLFRLKEPKGRIARWIEILSAYDFSIEYRKGQKHMNADSLSRCPDPWDCQCPDQDNLESLKCGPCAKCSKRFREMKGFSSHPSPDTTDAVCEQSSESIRAVGTRSNPSADHESGSNPEVTVSSSVNQWLTEQDLVRVQKLQEKDPNLYPIIKALTENHRPPHSEIVAMSPAVRYYWSIWNSLSLQNGCLYRRFYRQDGTGSHLQFIVPKSIRPEILQQMHNSVISGHLGQKKTLEKLLQRFYWFNVREDVQMWLLKCDICAANKPPIRTPRAPLGKMLVGAPLDRISVDFLGPLPVTPRNNRYILLATDHFTKWVEVMAVPDQTAKTCAQKLLNEVIARYGCPLTILSDQGGAFESSIFRELCKLLEIKKTRSSPRNPRCNGQAERFNRSLLRMIKAYLRGEQTDWDLNLGCLAAAYRASPCESTGLTPNLLFMGREVRLPAELAYGSQCNNIGDFHSYGDYVEQLQSRMQHAHEIARKHLHTSAKRQSEIYDSKLSVYKYKVGDLVWVAQEGCKPGLSPKLQASYRGPCLIVHKHNDLDYRVRLSRFGLECVLHHNKLKPYEGENIPLWIQAVKRHQC